MRTFEVTQRDSRGRGRDTCRVAAGTASEAVARVRAMAPGHADTAVYAVYRHRRLRGRRFVGLWSGSGPGSDGGQAGVREPRRPLPSPPSLSVALEVSRTGQ
jgi:hypothetical protein